MNDNECITSTVLGEFMALGEAAADLSKRADTMVMPRRNYVLMKEALAECDRREKRAIRRSKRKLRQKSNGKKRAMSKKSKR